MVDLTQPDEDERLDDFRVGVDFSVAARDIGEARALVQRALQGDSHDGIPVIARDRQVVGEDQIWGVLDWQRVPPRPSQAALVQDRYPGLVNDVAAMEMLQAIMQAGNRPLVLPDLVPEETRERVGELVASLNREVMVDDPDSPGRLVYKGHAAEAAAYLAEGTYRAFDDNDREHALVVAPSELARSGRVSQAIPRDRHDSRTLDEIAALLQDHTREQSLPDLFRQVNRRLETTRRTGFPSWVPLETEPEPAPAPTQVYVGVIVWTDLEDQEPTMLVDSDPVRLTRNLATTLHEHLDGDEGFTGAAEFLESHPAPSQWRTPEDVDAWLQALNESTPYPAVSIQRLGVGPQPPGTTAVEPAVADAVPMAGAAGPSGAHQRVDAPLYSYQVPVDFSVSAPTVEEARRMVDDALVGGAERATPAMVQRGQHVRPDGDVEGVLGWQHLQDAGARTPVQESDPVSEVLQERAQDLAPDPAGADQSSRDSGPDRARQEP